MKKGTRIEKENGKNNKNMRKRKKTK